MLFETGWLVAYIVWGEGGFLLFEETLQVASNYLLCAQPKKKSISESQFKAVQYREKKNACYTVCLAIDLMKIMASVYLYALILIISREDYTLNFGNS